MPEHFKYTLILLFFVAYIATTLVFKPILRIAKGKNIVDNPDARKLQTEPVPVMGGIAVFFGIAMGLCFFKVFFSQTTLMPVLGVMIVMLYLGFIDDVVTIRAWMRFLMEIMMGLLLVYGMRCYIANFQGLWGIEYLSKWLGIALTALTFVGIVNAINMIDGVDGLSSAFGILIMCCFGLVCFLAHEFSYATLAAVCAGALVPFFIHNVFGWKTKMFIGDGGTMMMGSAITAMVITILKRTFALEELQPALDFSRIAFVLAVLSIPIADTLRVMIGRMARGRSPFDADKTHLHHIFLSAGFSYIGITMREIGLNVAVILVFVAAWLLGASNAVQLYVVILAAALADLGSIWIIRRIQDKKGAANSFLQRRAQKSHVERKGLWLKIQKIVDWKA